MVKKNTCVFISGKGSNLRNLILRSREYIFPIKIKLIISNHKNAEGILYAKKYSIPYLIVNTNKRNFENIIFFSLIKYQINLICLAGYMKIISKEFIQKFRKKIINIHPSLLPRFKGLNTFSRILKNKECKTGCTVHYVNKQLDSGKIINKKIFLLIKKMMKILLDIKLKNLSILLFLKQ